MSHREGILEELQVEPYTTSVRARSPHPPEDDTPRQDATPAFEKNDEIEMAYIQPEHTSKDDEGPVPYGHAFSKFPWWRPHLQFATLCWSLFMAGWNDGTTGPLLPRMQEYYRVSTLLVSFVSGKLKHMWLDCG